MYPAALAIAAVLAACSGGAASQTQPPTVTNPIVAGSAAAAAGRAVEVGPLVAAAPTNDGQSVRVTGFLLIDGTSARLCAVSLESDPPECGGASVRLTGEVPRTKLEFLTRTTNRQLAMRTWGWVVVTGTFRASGVGGGPTIELGEIVIEEG
jgi:hypothetical protein